MKLAAEHLSTAAFGAAGERCMVISVAVAVGGAAEVLVEKLCGCANNAVVAEDTNADSDMGPLIIERARALRLGVAR